MPRVILPLFLLVVAFGCSVSGPLCARRAECAADPPGPDFQAVCAITYDGQVRSVRANREEVCQQLADAQVALDACRAELDCSDFNEADLGGNCGPELDDFEEARQEAEDECLVLD